MKFYQHIVFVLLVTSITQILNAQCDTINLGNDTIVCEGNTLLLDAGYGFSSYEWNDGSTNQYLTITESGEYWCKVEFLDSTNLVTNGDFEEGNIGFNTDYVWGVGGPWGILSEEGTYVIGENASLTHTNFSPCVDHTSGEGLFMIINGDTVQEENIWCQSVIVTPNTDYYFSGWFTSVHPDNPALLSYFINGGVIETVNLSPITCDWQNFVKDWNSGSNSTAEICIINQNTQLGGNDFGIDDIHLLRYCPSSDTILVNFEPAPEIDLGNDTVLCQGQELQLQVDGSYDEYLWSDGSTDTLFSIFETGIYWILVISENGCMTMDSIYAEFIPGIDVNLGNDTLLCAPGTIMLNAGEGYINYLWNDSTSMQTNLVTQAGIYWVNVIDENGCTGSDTISIDISPTVGVSLGGDTTICLGDDYTLYPGENFSSYLWQDGTTSTSYPISNAGTYWVIVTDENGCSGSDTVTINLNPSPVVSLGSDTTICFGANLVLDPGSQYSSYLWQDNSNLPIYLVTTTGNYSVTITNQFNCPATDEVLVEVSSPEINLGNDTLLCLGDTIFLNPGDGYESYLWQDNSSNPNYLVTLGGSYSVLVFDSNNCSTEQTIEITSLAKPDADLGGDKELCELDSLILEAQEGPYTYIWNGEPGNYFLEIKSSGTYSLEISNACGSDSDQVTVTEFPVPHVNLGPNQVLQPGESIQLDAGEGFDQYIWQDGSGDQYFLVSSEISNPDDPYYWVEVWDGPCKSSDTTQIELFVVKIPILLTPNGDGSNDTFMPIWWSGVKKHHIEIINRWGEKVWESDDFETGWDGKYKGTFVAEGTYFWTIELFYGDDNVVQELKGTLTVLKTGH